MKGVLSGLSLLAVSMIGGASIADAEVYGDGRDGWSLLDSKLINRQLHDQLSQESQESRLGGDLTPFALAGDAWVGWGKNLEARAPTRFHGYFLVDAYASWIVLEGLDLNLNLSVFNPSASDGYRFSAQILPGFAAHLYLDLGSPLGDPLMFDLVAVDLDLVTLGQGLLLESVPLEGVLGGFTWKGIELRNMFGGRVFWSDNLLTSSLSFFDGRLGGLFATWFSDALISQGAGTDPELLALFPELAAAPRDYRSDYIGLFGKVELFVRNFQTVQLAAEGSFRIDEGKPKAGLLLRADFLSPIVLPFRTHLGYQFRFYQQGFGPLNGLETPTTTPNVPSREEVYVTNSIEYFGVSPYYDQWSHTVMLELRTKFLHWFGFFGAGEYWMRFLSDASEGTNRVVYLDRFGRVPGVLHDVFYRLGLEVYPFRNEPHRFSLIFTNKAVESLTNVAEPFHLRFDHSPFFFVKGEIFL